MDFLDPKARKRHRIRLVIGYILMGLLITIATVILVFQAYGFDVNRKTGEVIQNGLIYVDSGPDKAAVYFNGQQQKAQTNNRYSLPAGDYDVRLTKQGYRDWNRSFNLEGGEVERFTYPLLIQNELKPAELASFDSAPALTTESPDRRYMLVAQAGSITNYTEYDLNSVDADSQSPQSRTFSLPDTLFTAATNSQSLELIEWSNDNKHLLVKHVFDGRSEFVVISRDQPETSININTLLGQNPDQVTLIDKKFDRWHLYTAQGGIISAARPDKTVTQLLTNVTVFKSHDEDTLLYAQNSADGKSQRISLLENDKSYSIKDVSAGTVKLDIARYDGSWYLLIGSDGDQKSYIYRDPQATLDKKDGTKITPVTVLHSKQPAFTAISFSQNTRFMTAQSGQHFEVYDAEYKQAFRYDIGDPIDPNSVVKWMDGHRMIMTSSGKATYFDFDGSNKQTLVANNPTQLPLFNRDYTFLYTIGNAATAGKMSLYSTPLRLNQDL